MDHYCITRSCGPTGPRASSNPGRSSVVVPGAHQWTSRALTGGRLLRFQSPDPRAWATSGWPPEARMCATWPPEARVGQPWPQRLALPPGPHGSTGLPEACIATWPPRGLARATHSWPQRLCIATWSSRISLAPEARSATWPPEARVGHPAPEAHTDHLAPLEAPVASDGPR